ncbi:MAG: hypothetical protein ACFCD0_19850 [Gemmataceae bacterium]
MRHSVLPAEETELLIQSPVFPQVRYLDLSFGDDKEKLIEKIITAPNRNPNLRLRIDKEEMSPEFLTAFGVFLTAYEMEFPGLGQKPWPEIYV